MKKRDGLNIDKDGGKVWYLNSKLPGADGQTADYINGTKIWFLDGRYHRTDGPAIERADGTKEFWVAGMQVHLTEEEFREALLEMESE